MSGGCRALERFRLMLSHFLRAESAEESSPGQAKRRPGFGEQEGAP